MRALTCLLAVLVLAVSACAGDPAVTADPTTPTTPTTAATSTPTPTPTPTVDTDAVVPLDQVRATADDMDAREFEQILYDATGITADDVDHDELYLWARTGMTDDGEETWGRDTGVLVTDTVPESWDMSKPYQKSHTAVTLLAQLMTDSDGDPATGGDDDPPHELHGMVHFSVFAFDDVADAEAAFDASAQADADRVDTEGARMLDPMPHPAIAEQQTVGLDLAGSYIDDGSDITVAESGKIVERVVRTGNLVILSNGYGGAPPTGGDPVDPTDLSDPTLARLLDLLR